MKNKRIFAALLAALLMMSAAYAVEMTPAVSGRIAAMYPSEVTAVTVSNVAGTAAQVIAETNLDRARYGLQPLRESAELNRAAAVRAKEIAEKFSHTRPDGSRWNTVSSAALAENIARGHNSPARVAAAWMSSPGHRANILRESYGSIGVAALNVNGVMHWVQLFGR